MRVALPGGSLVGLSYSQRRSPVSRGYCEYLSRRLLVFARDHIFLASHLVSSVYSPSLASLGPASSTGCIIYGSFVNDHKPDVFVTVNEAHGGYLVRTITLTEEPGQGRAVGGSRRGHLGIHTSPSADVNEDSQEEGRGTFGLKVEQEETIKEFSGQEILCIKIVKNVTCGSTELLLTTSTTLITVTITRHSILPLCIQKMGSPVRSIDYWSGYYFCLSGLNEVLICKRTTSRVLQPLKTFMLQLPNIGSLWLSDLKIPALDWSNRLFDVLHSELPHFLLLVGHDRDTGHCFVVKYDLCKSCYSSAAMMDTTDSITCINYGPYDNGPVLVGLSGGEVLAFDYYTLELLYQLSIHPGNSIKSITYQPCSRLIIGTDTAVYACSLTLNAHALVPELAKHLHVTIQHHE